LNADVDRLFAGGLFAVSRLAWMYSTHAEVFALNNFFIAFALYLTLKYFQTNEKRYALTIVCMFSISWQCLRDVLLGAFVFGLAGTNQHTAVFFAAPITILILLWDRKRLLNWKDVIKYDTNNIQSFVSLLEFVE